MRNISFVNIKFPIQRIIVIFLIRVKETSVNSQSNINSYLVMISLSSGLFLEAALSRPKRMSVWIVLSWASSSMIRL